MIPVSGKHPGYMPPTIQSVAVNIEVTREFCPSLSKGHPLLGIASNEWHLTTVNKDVVKQNMLYLLYNVIIKTSRNANPL